MSSSLASRTGSALRWQAVQFVGVKLIYLGRLVVLARILSPDAFGLFGVSLVALDLLLALSNPGVQQALVYRQQPEKRDYDAAFTIGLVRAFVVALPLIALAPWISQLVAEPRATALIQLMALQPVLQAVSSIKVAELQRDLRFRELALIELVDAVFNTGVAVALSFHFGVWALVLGRLAGIAGATIASYLVAPYRPRLTLLRSALRPLVIYGRWVFLAGILGVSANVMIRAVVTRELGAAQLGLYVIAGNLAFLAYDASQALVDKVAFPLYARMQDDEEEAARTFRFFLTAIGAILLPASIGLILVAPGLVEHVLGPRWDGTVPVMRVLALLPVVGLIGGIASPVFLGYGRPRVVAGLELVQFVTLALVLFPLIESFGIVGVATALLLATLASQVPALIQLTRLVGRPLRGMGRRGLWIAMASLGCGVATWSILQLLPGTFGVLAAVVGGGSAVGVVLASTVRAVSPSLVDDVEHFFPGALARLALLLRPRKAP